MLIIPAAVILKVNTLSKPRINCTARFYSLFLLLKIIIIKVSSRVVDLIFTHLHSSHLLALTDKHILIN